MSDTERVRLDKWLWAARFYRTRARAKQAIDAGRVRVDGARGKPSREIAVGVTIDLVQGDDPRTVRVTGLADRRGSATDAAFLYQETDASVKLREERAAERRLLRAAGVVPPPRRPDKRDRRALTRFKQDLPAGAGRDDDSAPERPDEAGRD